MTLPYFNFELQHEPETWHLWFSQPTVRWFGLPVAFVYIVLVFAGKWYMEKHQRFELRTFLILWNLWLTVFSWWGSMRMVPYFWDVVSKHGIDYSLCDDFAYRNPVTGFWILAFVFSKIPELFDTAFIILRKQKLIFLHWYHHATVVILAFGNLHALPGIGLWQTTMNFSVHSLMYNYYLLRALNIKPPQFVNQIITTLQILQMIAACLLGGRAFYFIVSGQTCGTDTLFTSGLAFIFYFSYLLLFVQFFVDTYLAPRKHSLLEKKKSD